jgi:hypothetical protein
MVVASFMGGEGRKGREKREEEYFAWMDKKGRSASQ